MKADCLRSLDPLLTLTHILSVCIFSFTVQENWQHLKFQSNCLSREIVEKHTETAIEFILAAVKNYS